MSDYSSQELLILEILQENGKEMYGLDIIEKSGGRLRRGTVYVWLDMLEDKGDVTSRKEEKNEARKIAKRLYKITDQGIRILIDRTLSEQEVCFESF